MAQMLEKAPNSVNAGLFAESSNYWADKQPCWEKCHCPEMIKADCPSAKYQFLPCWEIEGTYCKLDDHGATGKDTSICEVCRVYKKYGNGEPVRMKLWGKGMNVHIAEIEKSRV
ncbi:MAG: hypothetical protein JXA01_02435 [Dehalococcoidia bacterium]|nr:hypothetical protein [Dehalococcoidia bacterium]